MTNYFKLAFPILCITVLGLSRQAVAQIVSAPPDSDFIPTADGMVYKDCLYMVPSGSIVGSDGSIRDDAGALVSMMSSCPYLPRQMIGDVSFGGQGVCQVESGTDYISHGFPDFATYTTTNWFSEFFTGFYEEFNVPSALGGGSPLIDFWSGLESTAGTPSDPMPMVLQGVLRFGEAEGPSGPLGSTSTWELWPEYINYLGQESVGTPLVVDLGDQCYTNIWMNSSNQFEIEVKDMTLGTASSLIANVPFSYPQYLDQYVMGALEVYYLDQCGWLPSPSGSSFSFYDVAVQNTANGNWEDWAQVPYLTLNDGANYSNPCNGTGAIQCNWNEAWSTANQDYYWVELQWGDD